MEKWSVGDGTKVWEGDEGRGNCLLVWLTRNVRSRARPDVFWVYLLTSNYVCLYFWLPHILPSYRIVECEHRASLLIRTSFLYHGIPGRIIFLLSTSARPVLQQKILTTFAKRTASLSQCYQKIFFLIFWMVNYEIRPLHNEKSEPCQSLELT